VASDKEGRRKRDREALYLHGCDDVHVGAGVGGAAEAAGFLVEAVDELRRLVQDVVVLVHERVAHLRARANRIVSEVADRASGLGGRAAGSEPSGGDRERGDSELLRLPFAPAGAALRRRAAATPWAGVRVLGEGGLKRAGFVVGSAREFLLARLDGKGRERRRGGYTDRAFGRFGYGENWLPYFFIHGSA
jgi:hypothetical protein